MLLFCSFMYRSISINSYKKAISLDFDLGPVHVDQGLSDMTKVVAANFRNQYTTLTIKSCYQ